MHAPSSWRISSALFASQRTCRCPRHNHVLRLQTRASHSRTMFRVAGSSCPVDQRFPTHRCFIMGSTRTRTAWRLEGLPMKTTICWVKATTISHCTVHTVHWQRKHHTHSPTTPQTRWESISTIILLLLYPTTVGAAPVPKVGTAMAHVQTDGAIHAQNSVNMRGTWKVHTIAESERHRNFGWSCVCVYVCVGRNPNQRQHRLYCMCT